MNPTKLLIAQRLAEHAREGRAIVSLMRPFADDPRWAGVAARPGIAETADIVGQEMQSDGRHDARHACFAAVGIVASTLGCGRLADARLAP